MKDFRSPSKLTVVTLLLSTLLGCQALEGRQSPESSGSPIVIATPAVDFGTVVVGTSGYIRQPIYNRGRASLTFLQATPTSSDFVVASPGFPLTIGPHSSVSIGIRFSPHSVGSPQATIALAAGPHSTAIAVKGTAVAPGKFVASPASVRFGRVAKGKTQTISETFTNQGSTDVTVSEATVSDPVFQLSGAPLPLTLAPGQAATFQLTFAPQSVGGASGTLSVTSSASLIATGHVVSHVRFHRHDSTDTVTTIPLAGLGTGMGQLSAAPQSVNFTGVKVGASASKTVVLTNSGTVDVAISQAATSAAGFALSGMGVPMTLAAGQSKTLNVVYSPSAAGNASGNLSIVSDASNPVMLVGLSANSAVATPPGTLTSSLSSLSFGSVQVGSTKTLAATLTNTGGTEVNISQANLSGSGFSVSGLAANLKVSPGQSAPFAVTYAPAATGNASGGLSIVSDASNSTLPVSFSGTATAAPTPGALASNLTVLNFGSVSIGKSQTQSGILTNSGGSPVNITQATVTGSGFSGPNLALPLKLNSGQSATFTVSYAPSVAGTGSGSVTIVSDASNPNVVLSLAGAATAAPTPGVLVTSLSSLAFGSVQVGNNKLQSLTLSNTGGSAVTVSQANITGGGYAVSGLTFPLNLTPGQSAGFSVSYSPFAIGSGSGSLSMVSDASNPTLTVSLTGTATAAPVPAVLSSSLSSLVFGNVPVGTAKTESETLTNFGTTTITVSQATLNGTGFSLGGMALPLKLTGGQSANFLVTYTPATAGSSSGTLAITSDASNPSVVASLSGTGIAPSSPGVLSSNLSSMDFGSVQVGNNKLKSASITNSGGSTLTISQANLSGVGFSLSGLYLPLQLNAGDSFTFDVVFAPSAAANVTGSLMLVSDASIKTTGITLSGSGAAAGVLNVGPAGLSFGNVTVGATKNMTVTLSASNASVVVSSASLSSGEFTVNGSFPMTIPAGQSVPLTVSFAPQASGSASASLNLTSNASSGTTTESLTGTGAAAVQHQVELTWDPSATASTYNVYRGVKSGGPYAKLTSSVTTGASFIDTSVQAGQTYFYVTTAVSSTNQESDDSNEVQAVIPTP